MLTRTPAPVSNRDIGAGGPTRETEKTMSISNQFQTGPAPKGFTLPGYANELIGVAALCGWRTGWVWDVDSAKNPFVKVSVGDPETGETFTFTWHSRDTGTLRLFSKLHQGVRGAEWTVGPSLKAALHRIRETHAQRS